MTTFKSMGPLSNVRYVDIFDYIKDTVFMIERNQEIYTRIVYFRKGM